MMTGTPTTTIRRQSPLLAALLALAAIVAWPAPAAAALGDQAAPCAAALSANGLRWDDLPMEPFAWDGEELDLPPIGEISVRVCVASGPLQLLPASNRIGCVLVADVLAYIDDKLACGAFRGLERRGSDTLVWTIHVSAAVDSVQAMEWVGTAFRRGESYLECWDGSRADESLECPLP